MAITPNYRRRRVRVEAIVWDGTNLVAAARLLNSHLEAYDRTQGTLAIKLGEEVLVAHPDEWLIMAEDGEPLPPASASVFERLYESLIDAPPA